MSNMERRSLLLGVIPLGAGAVWFHSRPEFGTVEGTRLADLEVAPEFDSEVKLEADCREESYTVEPGAEYEIEREKLDESCKVRVVIDGTEEYSQYVRGHQQLRLEVEEDGEVTARTMAY